MAHAECSCHPTWYVPAISRTSVLSGTKVRLVWTVCKAEDIVSSTSSGVQRASSVSQPLPLQCWISTQCFNMFQSCISTLQCSISAIFYLFPAVWKKSLFCKVCVGELEPRPPMPVPRQCITLWKTEKQTKSKESVQVISIGCLSEQWLICSLGITPPMHSSMDRDLVSNTWTSARARRTARPSESQDQSVDQASDHLEAIFAQVRPVWEK